MDPALKNASGGINPKRHLGPQLPPAASEALCLWLLPYAALGLL